MLPSSMTMTALMAAGCTVVAIMGIVAGLVLGQVL